MADKRITDVEFIESLNSNESFFINRNNTLKQINKSDIVFDITNGGTGATNAENARENLGAASSVHNHDASEITSGVLSIDRLPNMVISISNGGTGSSNGADGLNNLFAAGATILSSYQYGTTLPTDNSSATKGRIFFKKVSS